MELDKLKKKRKTKRGVVTRLLNKIGDAEKADPSQLDPKLLKQWLEQLEQNREDMKKLDDDILEKMVENDIDDEDRDKEAVEASEQQEKITYTKICLEELLENRNKSKSFLNVSPVISSSNVNPSSNKTPGARVKAKLPQLELKKFSGKVAEWQEFWDAFESAIDKDEDLAAVDKFKYLRSFLEEPARNVIAGIPLTEKDYKTAVDILKSRFAKPSVIQRAHINEMINLPAVFSEKNVIRLRTLQDQIEIHYRGLEAIGVDRSSYSSIVVPILMEKVPEAIRYNMVRFEEKSHLEWTLDEFVRALGKEIEVRESHVPIFKPQSHGERPKFQSRSNGVGTVSALFVKEEQKCIFCQGNHKSEECSEVITPHNRKNILMKSGKCFICLRAGHRSFKCYSKAKCKNCKGRHHVAICSANANSSNPDPAPTISREMQAEAASASSLNVYATSWVGSTASSGVKVALQTALAYVNGVQMRVLFDTGSQKTFISKKAASKLSVVPVRSEKLGIKAFGRSASEIEKRDVYELTVCPMFAGKSVSIEAYEVCEISCISNVKAQEIKKNYSHLNKIVFSDTTDQELLDVDILCGSDYLWNFQMGEAIRGGPGEPVAVRTTLGWVLSGQIKSEKLLINDSVNVNLVHDTLTSSRREIESSFHKLWDLDSLGIKENDRVHEDVIDHIEFTGERYSVRLPWKVGHGPVPLNYANSKARLKSQLRKLKQTPEILKQYDSIITEQLEANVISEVSTLEQANKVSYLPHQAVCRENAETTKVRVVYDASCKDGKTSTSLNDCLHKGPALTPLIFDILLRFRANSVAIVGDIEKAFLNIEINPEDRDCLRFLWVKDVSDPEPEVVTYRFNRVVFGVSSSPFLLNAVIQHHLHQYSDRDPEFVRTMIEGFFVDDLVMSCKNTATAFEFYDKAKNRMSEGGFRLRKWKTSDKALGEAIANNERGWNEDACVDSQDGCSYAKETLGVSKDLGKKTKVLGVPWDSEVDMLEIDIGKTVSTLAAVVTKRGILSTLATLFDPLGLVSPIGVMAKVLFQELCSEGLGWDDKLPESKLIRWQMWLDDLKKTDKIAIPRCMLAKVEGEIIKVSLHGFGDASRYAYCAMIFLVCVTTQGTYSRPLCSKTRVAPLKALSIPRLELMSARILVNLMDTVKNALHSQINIDCVRFWLDSKTALFWIHNQGEWKIFVQHRVNEILQRSQKKDWGHVAGKENPADIGSRGAVASELQDSNLWWNGPSWLTKGENAWPGKFNPRETCEASEEKRNVCVLTAVLQEQPRPCKVIDLKKYDRLNKLLRITAYVRRFITNRKNRKDGRECKEKDLSAEEIKEAENTWVRDSQITLQEDANFGKIRESLDIVEQNGVLVCRGRLEHSDLEERAKFPIILPKNCHFTDLVILQCHEQVHHCKVRSTLAELRARYWITQGRQYVKKVIHDCFICRKLEGKPYHAPKIAPLPDFRVSKAPPFDKVGIDFAGPVYIKCQRDMEKAWIALFTCCVTRAVHLELVENLTAPTFVNCLRRFCARRGTPSLIVSDNAKTFKSTAKFLKKLCEQGVVQEVLSSKRIEWKFNLERAAWYGGFFERMIGTMKRCLRKVTGNAKLTADEFTTVLSEVECTLNSRPLTCQYDEIETVLTPFHLIFGRRLSPLSEDIGSLTVDNLDKQEKISNRFLHLTNILNHFWQRWRREYLTDLRDFHRHKDTATEKILVGDIVLIQEDNKKRGLWKIGRIERLISGKDGVVRGAVVRKAGGKCETLSRHIIKLYPLEIPCRYGEGKESGEEGEKVGTDIKKSDDVIGQIDPGSATTLTRSTSSRAAAKDSRWKTNLMLDS